jgi:hypothetical protein
LWALVDGNADYTATAFDCISVEANLHHEWGHHLLACIIRYAMYVPKLRFDHVSALLDGAWIYVVYKGILLLDSLRELLVASAKRSLFACPKF